MTNRHNHVEMLPREAELVKYGTTEVNGILQKHSMFKENMLDSVSGRKSLPYNYVIKLARRQLTSGVVAPQN